MSGEGFSVRAAQYEEVARTEFGDNLEMAVEELEAAQREDLTCQQILDRLFHSCLLKPNYEEAGAQLGILIGYAQTRPTLLFTLDNGSNWQRARHLDANDLGRKVRVLEATSPSWFVGRETWLADGVQYFQINRG